MSSSPDTIGVAMLGYAFMGNAHSRAFREASYLEPALQPRLVSISGRTAEKVEEARRLNGWEEATTDWREQVADERVQLFDNGKRLGFDLYPYTEDQVAAVRRSVLQWNFIDSAAVRIDDAALRQAQQEKDAVRAYELVYAALGAE